MNKELIRKMIYEQWAAVANDEARLANELQEQFPNMTRTHALKEAKILIGRHGKRCNMRQTLINAYLDYWNNYLTVAKWAEHNGLTEEQGEVFINLAREVYNSKHPDE